MRKLLTILVIAALILGGWYVASPWLAMKGIVDAAQDRDLEALDARIDFEQLQSDTSGRFREAIDESTRDGGALEQLGGALVGGLGDLVIENAITPRGMANLVTVGSFGASLVPERFRGQELEWDVERQGLNRFEGVSTWEDGSAGPKMLFTREGIGWELTGVELMGGD